MQGSFDASQFAPKQGGGAHPVGKGFDATISNTEIKPTSSGEGGMFVVTFTTPAGSIVSRYNLWNKNEKAVQIAHGELSALCHATGVFRLDFQNDGAALRNARCKIDVGLQNEAEPDGYVEVKKIMDANGNEPGRGPGIPPQQPAQAAPAPSWGNPAPAQPQAPAQTPAWQPSQQGQANPTNTPPWATPNK